MRTSPVSGTVEPAATPISVLLPAPLPPTRAWISPARTSNDTPLSATTPGNVFVTSVSESATEAGPDSSMGPLHHTDPAVAHDRHRRVEGPLQIAYWANSSLSWSGVSCDERIAS